MDTLLEGKRTGVLDPDFGRALEGRVLPPRKSEREKDEPADLPARSDVAADVPVFTPPFLGARVAKGISIDDIASHINETALFRNQWQFRPEKRDNGPESDAEFKDRIRSVLRDQLDRAKAEGLLVPAVAWGYFPVNSDGEELVVWTDDDRTAERLRFHFPRQKKGRYLCISDFFRSVASGDKDYAAFHVVTIGDEASERERELFEADKYQDYLLLHGLSVPSAVPGIALFVGLPGVPRPRGPGQGGGAARHRAHRRDPHRGVPPRARAEHVGDRRPPPRGEVLHRVIR
jgi:5-methyltetrahydrofolate--homocysteine methyltransferase